MPRSPRAGDPRAAATGTIVAILLLAGTGAAAAAGAAGGDAGASPSLRPELHARRETALLASGATLLAVGLRAAVDRPFVPSEGLDPADVRWSFDRRSIRESGLRPDTDSDYTRDALAAYPLVLAWIGEPSGARWSGTARRSVPYFEAIVIAQGLSAFVKGVTDRPRPFNYVPAADRPDGPAFDSTKRDAFQSMPSGHASLSFCAATFATTEHLLTRPDAGWRSRTGVAFLGGFLAGLTSGLRIEAGQHFPSDTIVGAAIGTASGLGIPLLHRYVGRDGAPARRPTRRAWWQALAGQAVGVGAGFLATEL